MVQGRSDRNRGRGRRFRRSNWSFSDFSLKTALPARIKLTAVLLTAIRALPHGRSPSCAVATREFRIPPPTLEPHYAKQKVGVQRASHPRGRRIVTFLQRRRYQIRGGSGWNRTCCSLSERESWSDRSYALLRKTIAAFGLRGKGAQQLIVRDCCFGGEPHQQGGLDAGLLY